MYVHAYMHYSRIGTTSTPFWVRTMSYSNTIMHSMHSRNLVPTRMDCFLCGCLVQVSLIHKSMCTRPHASLSPCKFISGAPLLQIKTVRGQGGSDPSKPEPGVCALGKHLQENINPIFLLFRCSYAPWATKWFEQSVFICRGGAGNKFTWEYYLKMQYENWTPINLLSVGLDTSTFVLLISAIISGGYA